MHSVSGSTPEATDTLRLVVYLTEVDRQAELFSRSFADALHAAVLGDDNEVWRHLQSALFAAIVVNRLLTNESPWREHPGWTKAQAREAAQWRVKELRRALELPGPSELPFSPLYLVARVRDSLEHVDERLDRAVRSPGIHSISDWYLSSGTFLVTREGNDENVTPGLAGLRAFYPEGGLLFFDRTELDVFFLDVEMLKLRNNVQEAMKELPKHRGRASFGGSQFVEIDQTVAVQRFARWTQERREVAAEIEGPVPEVPISLRWEEPRQ